MLKSTAIALFAGGLTLGAFGAGVYGAVALNPHSLAAAAAAHEAPQLALSLADNALIAKAAVLYDTRTNRVIYQKNAYQALPLASLTKLMAVETVLSVHPPNTPVEITARALTAEGDSGFRVGETVMLGDLISFALVASSNDAMEAAAASLGPNSIDLMNEAAVHLGLTQTRFYNATGLDVDAATSGAYGSAYDVARLAALFYKEHPSFFELTTRPDVSIEHGGATRTAPATTEPLQNIPGFVAAKTGYTDLAGGNVVAIFDLEPGFTVVAAVLGSTREGRFADAMALLSAAREALNTQ